MEARESTSLDRVEPSAGRDWRPAAWFLGIVLAVLTLTWPTWVGLLWVWRHVSGYSHGLLVAPIAAWLAWRALTQRPARRSRPAWWMLVAVAVVSFAWLFFRLATVRVLEQSAATVLLWTAATAVLGWAWARALLFPIAFLFFALPIWDALVPVLQPLTVAAAGTMCQLIGIPTYLEGNIVNIPNGTFAIEGGCAGAHYFAAAMTVAALYAHLEYRRWSSWLKLLGLAAAFAMVANWIRVVVVIYVGHAAGMQHPWVKDHNMVGWVLFAVGLVPLFTLARRLEDGAVTPQGEVNEPELGGRATSPAIAGAFLAALLAAGWPHAVTPFVGTRGSSSSATELVARAGAHGWRGPLEPDADWAPAFPTADAQVLSAYENGGVRVELFRASYDAQSEAREVINYDNRIEGHEAWTVTEDSDWHDARLGNWRRCLLARRDGRQRIVLYRYTIAGRPTASRLEAKLRQGLSAFTGDRSASILAASAPCRGSCETAAEDVARFLSDMTDQTVKLR